jgi:hypothetical protein
MTIYLILIGAMLIALYLLLDALEICDYGCTKHTFAEYHSHKKRICIDCGLEEKIERHL